MRRAVGCIALLLSATAARAQDMPLSDVLAPGESWQRVPDLSGVQFLAADSHGTVYTGEPESGRITAIEPGGKKKHFANVPGLRGMTRGPAGGLYVCQPEKQRLLFLDATGKESVAAGELALETVVVSRAGRVYGTTPREHAIYAVERGGKPRRVAEGLAEPSGLAFWADEGTLVVGDAAGKHLWAYRVASDGALSSGDAYYSLRTRPKEASSVAALTIDAAGRLYAATREGVQVFDPTGRMSGLLLRPERSPVSGVAFGGEGLDRLYVACAGHLYVRKTLARGFSGVNGKR